MYAYLIVQLYEFLIYVHCIRGFPGGASGKESALQCRRPKSCGFNPWVGKISWRKAWQPTPVFLPGKSPWTEEPGGLQSMGSQRVKHDWCDRTQAHTLHKLPRLIYVTFPVSPKNLLYFSQSVASSELTAILNFCHQKNVLAEHYVKICKLCKNL